MLGESWSKAGLDAKKIEEQKLSQKKMRITELSIPRYVELIIEERQRKNTRINS
jgi:hypothetical protein